MWIRKSFSSFTLEKKSLCSHVRLIGEKANKQQQQQQTEHDPSFLLRHVNAPTSVPISKKVVTTSYLPQP